MKKLCFLLLATLFCGSIFAQTEIKIEDIKNHIGDSVKICAKIYGGVFLGRTDNKPTFLNVGGDYPNAPLTVVIWPPVRATYAGQENPETYYKGKTVCIYGKLVLYKEKPQIVIEDKKQIVE
jgi:hypothetical protein